MSRPLRVAPVLALVACLPLLALGGCGKSAPGPGASAPAPAATELPAPSEAAAAPVEADTAAAAAEDPTGTATEADVTRWQGTIEVPKGAALAFTIALAERGGGWTGTITIPAQNAVDLALTAIAVDAHALAFTLALPGAPEAAWPKFRATIAADGSSAAGTLHQGGLDMPIRLRRASAEEAAASAPRRPQLPVPPFPYAAREVAFEHPVTGATIAGTLTAPEGGGKHAAVVLISGSGLQDRDETVFGHKPFLVLADWLTRHGIAVLRVDDRGVGGSTGDAASATVLDNASDAEASYRFLREQPEVDPARVGLVGHSEGGIIAPIVASRVPEVAFVVSLAGTGMSGAELMPHQYELVQRAEGVGEEAVRASLALYKAMIAAAAKGEPREVVTRAMKEMLAAQPETAGVSKEELASDRYLEGAADQLLSPWFLSFLRLDPAAYWRLVRCPVLAVGGSLDTQVPAEQNLALIAQAVRAGGNGDVTTVTLPSLNHLFQTAKTGGVSEYGSLEETFAPAALELISAWITSKTQAAAAP